MQQSKKTSSEEDLQFAKAIITRNLQELPPILPSPPIETVIRSLQCCLKATEPRTTLLLRSLRKCLSVAVKDNDTAIPLVSPLLHQLAIKLPSESLAGDVAAGLLLLFSHGLGQVSLVEHLDNDTNDNNNSNKSMLNGSTDKPLVIMLGFAGGTVNDIKKYSSRLYNQTEYDIIIITASEIPEIYQTSVDRALRATRGRFQWTIHLFSKAGFLMCSRIIQRIQNKINRMNEIKLLTCNASIYDSIRFPNGIIWDSSPGSLFNYNEFIQGTWQSAELVARRGNFEYTNVSRNRMNRLLNSNEYPLGVRDSYAPMHNIMPYPSLSSKTKHLFLYSNNDPVCSPDEILNYAHQCMDYKCVVVGGTHCDGLFWSNKRYFDSVHELMNSL